MPTGVTIYQQFKTHLDRQGRTVTEFAAALGTGQQQLKDALHRYAGGERLPRNPITRSILEAVAKELGDVSILPSTKVNAGEGEP